MEEELHKEAKEDWRFADAARITDVNASSEDCKSMSRRVSVAIDSGDRQRRRSRYVRPWERRKNRPSMGEFQRRCVGFLPCTLARRGMDTKKCAVDGSSGKAGEDHHASLG